MQIEDFFIGVGAVVEMLMEGVAPGEAPTDAQVIHAVSAGMRAVAERLERERAATVGELEAQVQALSERVDLMESRERERDARAAAAEETRNRIFAELSRRTTERPEPKPAPGPAPGPRVLSTIGRLVASGTKPAAIRRWLLSSGWTRRSQRSALLREAATELQACEPQALREVVIVVTSDMVWPDLIDTLADLEIAEADDGATGDVVDLAGARRAAKRRRG